MTKFWINKLGQKKPIQNFGFEFNLDYNLSQPDFYFEVDIPYNWNSFINENLTGIWKFEPILPIGFETVTKLTYENIDELATPLEIPELAKILGVRKFFIIPCLNGKGGSFKDIEAAFVIGKLLDWNCGTPAIV